MGIVEDNGQLLLLNDNRIPIDKEIKDLEYSNLLNQKAYIFKDGNKTKVDLFLFKIGLNGNGFGVDLDTADATADDFEGKRFVIDPDGKIHQNKKYSLEYIIKHEPELSVGTVTKVKKYDTDGDGRNDFFRAIVDLDDAEDKKVRFKQALAAGINETSPTIIPLNMNEPIQKIKTWKPQNIVLTRHGAYLTDSKIKAICTGSPSSCNNALAASLENQKNDVSLMQVLQSYSNMGNDNATGNSPDSGNVNNAPVAPNGSTINIFANPQDGKVTNDEQKNTETNKDNKQIELPKEVQDKLARLDELEKTNKTLINDSLTILRNEIAPVELFKDEPTQKEFIKLLGDDLDKVKYFATLAKQYVPLMITLYTKTKSSDKNADKDGKDESNKDSNNPLAASLPPIDNNASGKTDITSEMLKKMSLKDIFNLTRKVGGSVQ